ncbi:HEAT repeat domain-containing protein [Devosia sp. XK-2]|uniref:HEAT repeat domain-containing protein n=1 Tax=Devosia sp. XK-2 TaxID=3126689 RepID=UPI0030CD4253
MSTLDQAFAHPDPSARLNAVLLAGIKPSLLDLDALLNRCAVEPDFQVREMLTWALIRLPAAAVVPRLIGELSREEAQARSQALHTLSKFRDASAWKAVAARLDDEDQGVVRTAWYAAVAIVPEDQRHWLAEKLALSLGRGDRDTQLSLSRALVGLGCDIIEPMLTAAKGRDDEAVRLHAAATQRLLHDADAGFASSLKVARREVALGKTRSTKG